MHIGILTLTSPMPEDMHAPVMSTTFAATSSLNMHLLMQLSNMNTRYYGGNMFRSGMTIVRGNTIFNTS